MPLLRLDEVVWAVGDEVNVEVSRVAVLDQLPRQVARAGNLVVPKREEWWPLTMRRFRLGGRSVTTDRSPGRRPTSKRSPARRSLFVVT